MYSELKNLFDKTRTEIFVCSLTYIGEKGTEFVSQITDEDIDEIEDNGIMTADFCKEIVRVARKIVEVIKSPVELYQFADAEGLFETEYFTNGKVYRRSELERIIRTMFNRVIYDNGLIDDDDEAVADWADYLDLEPEDINTLCEWR